MAHNREGYVLPGQYLSAGSESTVVIRQPIPGKAGSSMFGLLRKIFPSWNVVNGPNLMAASQTANMGERNGLVNRWSVPI